MRLNACLALVATTLLAGCQFNAFSSQSNEALNTQSVATFRDLIAGRDEALVARMSSQSSPEEVRAQLPQLKSLAGDCGTAMPRVIGTRSVVSNQGRSYTVSHSYDCPDRTVTTNATFITQDKQWKLQGFNLNAVMKPATPGEAPDASAPTAPDTPRKGTVEKAESSGVPT